jgi:glucan phosphorylase
MDMSDIKVDRPVAYFCSEYALTDRLPIFAGGLGVLAGDLVLEAVEQKIPLVAIGLFYHHGFGKQSAEGQFGLPLNPKDAGFKPLCEEGGEPVCLSASLDHRQLWFRVWERKYGKTVRVMLLDTDVPQNRPADRAITGYLYDPDTSDRLYQQLLLGVGGVKLLRHLKLEPRIYHLNEGHSCFVALELALEAARAHPEVKDFNQALELVRNKLVGTKHTIIPAAGSFYKKEMMYRALEEHCKSSRVNIDEVFKMGEGPELAEQFSNTKFFMRCCSKVNAVSKLHARLETMEHPESPLSPITNGVLVKRWLNKDIKISLGNKELWDSHQVIKHRLINWVNEHYKTSFSPEILTVVWARRLAIYKRPGLIFSNPERLEELVNHEDYPIQFIIAGNANPYDVEGHAVMKEVIHQCLNPRFRGRLVYLSNYGLGIAKKLVTGADVWLNTPVRGQEACGTSSMKSGINGVLQCTTNDGWIDEVNWSKVGWIVPNRTAEEDVYNILGGQVVPEYYRRNSKGVPTSWVARMKRTREVVLKYYTTERLWRDYQELLYTNSEAKK